MLSIPATRSDDTGASHRVYPCGDKPGGSLKRSNELMLTQLEKVQR